MFFASLFSSGIVKAHSGSVTFSALNYNNLVTASHDETYSNGIHGMQLAVLDAKGTTPVASIPSGTGTPGDPYLISNLAELYWIAYEISIQPLDNGTYFTGLYFKQTADIDASATSTWFDGEGWMPIGYLDEVSGNYKDFGGTYDGQGYVVSNIFINRTAESCVGLFGTVTGGLVKNLGVTNLSINAKLQTGGLVGYLYGTATLESCYTTGTVTAIDGTVGGLVGMNDGDNIIRQCYSECNVTGLSYVAGLFGQGNDPGQEVSNCYATGTITSTGENALTAGLIAYAYGTITNCYATGSVSNSNGDCAGLIQTNYANVSNCYASGAVTGKNICGGLIGANGDGKVINNCYSTGSVTASDPSGNYIGGFVGSNLGTISDSYTISQLVGSASNMGGFVGRNGSSTSVINNDCFWNTDVYTSGYGSNVGTFSALGKTTSEMQTASTFTSAGWSTSVWSLMDGKYPRLAWTITEPATSIFTGTGNWSSKANWDNGIPGATTNATIAGTCTIDANYEVAELTINSGQILSINPGKVLTVSGDLTNNAGITGLVLNSDATGTAMLMNNTPGVQATVEQYLTKDKWHYMGIPVTHINDVNDVFHNCYVAWSEESEAISASENGWYYLKAGDPLNAFMGYAIQYNTGNNDNDTTITFTGTLNTATIDTIFDSEYYGYNFISNPYPTTINWNISGGKTLTNTNNAIYVWNPDMNSYGSYVNGSSSDGQTQYIAPMQGFFIQVTTVTAGISFNDNAKSTQNAVIGSGFTNSPLPPSSLSKENIVAYILPIVTTQAVSDINITTATGNGNITNLGVPNPTAYGICWNTTGVQLLRIVK